MHLHRVVHVQQVAGLDAKGVAELVLRRAGEAQRGPRRARRAVVGRAEEQVREAEGAGDGLAALEEGAAVAPAFGEVRKKKKGKKTRGGGSEFFSFLLYLVLPHSTSHPLSLLLSLSLSLSLRPLPHLFLLDSCVAKKGTSRYPSDERTVAAQMGFPCGSSVGSGGLGAPRPGTEGDGPSAS